MIRKTRIMAAWKVLRGEWTARPPVTQTPSVWTTSGASGANCTVTWTQPPAFDPRRAGRRAVLKHADALRRLAR
jgi:hypothetical protein